jgi:hypothetical protein
MLKPDAPVLKSEVPVLKPAAHPIPQPPAGPGSAPATGAPATGAPTTSADAKPEQRRSRIALIAYLRAERRGFQPGFEVEDWLIAEQEVDQSPLQ